MKKALCMLLTTTLLTACISCTEGGAGEKNTQDETTTQPLQEETTTQLLQEETTTSPTKEETPLPSLLFSSYDDILNTVSLIAKKGGIEAFEAEMPTLDAREETIYHTLRDLVELMTSKSNEHTMRSFLRDIDGNGTKELYLGCWEGTVGNEALLKQTEVVFTLRGGVPMQDDGTLLARYEKAQEESGFSIPLFQEVLVTHPHYRIRMVDFQNGEIENLAYEIFSSNGALVREGTARSLFCAYREGDVIRFSTYDTEFYYSISQNQFSKVFYESYTQFAVDKIAYVKNGVLTVQNVFDADLYENSYPEYEGVYRYYFSEDGKSLDFRHYVEGAKKDGTATVCFEPLPIVRAIKICYVRTGPGINYDVVMISSGNPAYLRSATSDTARLLQLEPVIGGSYQSDDGTTRNDWYMISYHGKTCYVSADSFVVEEYARG